MSKSGDSRKMRWVLATLLPAALLSACSSPEDDIAAKVAAAEAAATRAEAAQKAAERAATAAAAHAGRAQSPSSHTPSVDGPIDPTPDIPAGDSMGEPAPPPMIAGDAEEVR